MLHLVDTNILVYRYDPRFPEKQRTAEKLLREGIESGEARLSHQSVVEFVAAATRPMGKQGRSLLSADEARREAEEMLAMFPLLYPSEGMLRLALRGWSAYGLPWFDALMWSAAEFHGVPLLLSEDFQNGRLYGTVRAQNPFA